MDRKVENIRHLKCFNKKSGKIFFITSSLNESNYLLLADLLMDKKYIIKQTSKEEVESQNPYLQDAYDMFFFDDNGFTVDCVDQTLKLVFESDV